ncbi:MAG: biotin--[acetyl-CoA-carboxylase] ligase [Opitutaceae bacterium]|jgi:BirA family biotin operon repressor/biotin-[acetyl-CoA-carboxylase] ligase|nr:biotin--[acetyl-CoA-carboxylase] ligase [Opitutaceae bacterium]
MSSETEYEILAALLDAGGACVSGERLASRLGVSRVAVFHHVAKLRAAGHPVEAVRAGGYRIAREPARLTRLGLRHALAARGVGAGAFTLLESVDSTNDEAARQLAAGREAPFVILAGRQTKGRGRFGRPWHSGTRRNLYASFAFRPRMPAPRMQTFTLWIGAALARFLTEATGARVGVKWPNDLLIGGKKAAGILTEARMDADQIRDLVTGIGLNLRPPAGGWPEELRGRATSLAENMPAPPPAHALVAGLVARVFEAYGEFVEGRHHEAFARDWAAHDVLVGRDVGIVSGNECFSGTVGGIDAEGSLLMKGADGAARVFRAGEVTIGKGGAA